MARKGYKTNEEQVEANRRYRQTEEGRERTRRSNAKSSCKRFIREYSTIEELEEIELLIAERKKAIKSK